MTAIRLMLGMAALVIAAAAQEPSTREALSQEPAVQGTETQREVPAQTGFYFSSPLTVSAANENQLQVGQRRFHDGVLLLTAPEFAFRSAAPQTDFFLGYKPELQLFKRYDDLNTLDHAARFRLTHRATPRFRLDIQDSFLQTEDPTRMLSDSILLLPRSQFGANTFNATVDYELSPRTRISPAFLNTVSKLLLPDVQETDLFTGRFEQMGTAAMLTISHMLARQHQIAGSYSYFVIQDLKQGIHFPFGWAAGSQSTHGVSVGYQYGFEPYGISLEVSAGALLSSATTYRVAARFEKRWPSFVFAAGYSRELALLSSFNPAVAALRLGGGVVPDNFYQMAMVNLEGRLGDRWGLELRTQAGKSNSGIQIDDIESVSGRVRLSYRLTDRIYPFVGVELHNQSYSEFLLTSLARQRYFAGFAIVLSRPPEWQVLPDQTGEWPDAPWPGSARTRNPGSERWRE